MIIKKKTVNKKSIKRLTKKERLELKLLEKKEKAENYQYFNLINGYIPSLNVIINNLNDYLIMIQVNNFNSLIYIIENMHKLKIKELEIFNHKGFHFLSLKFDVNKNKNGNIIKYDYIVKFIKDIEWRKDEFRILRLPEILIMLKEKVYRNNELNVKVDEKTGKNVLYINDKKIRDIIINDKHDKNDFQKNILGKNVKIENDYITFNNDSNVKNQVLGLQMYPSFLYSGFLTELNHIENVETCTYIKYIDIKKCINNINKKKIISFQENSLKDYMQENLDKGVNMYNTTFFIHISGNDEEIKKTREIISKISFKYHILLNDYVKQQKRAFTSFLPLMNNRIKCFRAITDYYGILPFNENIIKYFKNGLLYGKELFSNNDFTFNRFYSGVVLSSDNSFKEYFMDTEMQDFYNRHKKSIYKINFKDTSRLKSVDLIKVFKDYNLKEVNEIYNINDEQLFILAKVYIYLCLSRYKDTIVIEKNDKLALDDIFNKLENKIKQDGEKPDFKNKIYRIFNYLERNNQKLYGKIIKEYYNPNEEINNLMKGIFELFNNAKNYTNGGIKKYIYVYESQEITDCLDIIFKYIFNNNFENVFLFSSSNDFVLLNNEFVCNEMFKAKYINMFELSNNDISKVNRYLQLPDEDVVHLNNKNYIAGILYTDMCEFNYYINKGVDADSI